MSAQLPARGRMQLPALFGGGDGQVATLPDDASPEVRLGAIIAGVFFVGFLGWAAIAPLDAAAYAEGQVRVSGNRQTVQHREGGVVGALYVKEAQQVKQGDVLLELSGAEVKAQERALSSQAIGLKAQRARLQAEQVGAPAITWPPEFATYTGQDAEEAQRAMAVQQQQFLARSSTLGTQRSVLGQRTAQLNEQVQGIRRQLAANQEQQRLIGEELEGARSLEARGFYPKTKLRELERAQAQLQGQLGQYNAQIAQAGEQQGETRLQVIELDKVQKEQIAAELRDVEFALNDVLPKLQAAQDQLARVQIRSPATGTVVGLSVFTVGGVIAPGQKVLDVVPEKAPLLIEARVAPNDADDLRVGQKAQIKFTGLHERGLPTLHGEVTKLSADSFVDEKTGVSYYTADVTVPLSELEVIRRSRGASFDLRPGMPVQVLIPLRNRTALQYLFEPLGDTLWRSGRQQ